MPGGAGITDRLKEVLIEAWEKGLKDFTYKNHVLLPMIEAKGKIKRGMHGHQCRWVARTKKFDLEQHVDGAQIPFGRNDLTEAAVLGWARYRMTEAMTEEEMLEHGGKEKMVDIFSERLQYMAEDASERLNVDMYIDGNATGNTYKLDGIETFCGIGAQTATDALATSASDTYAGLSTAYGAFGGSSDSDPSYKAFSPVIVNTNRTVSAATVAWSTNADEYLRRGIIEATYGASQMDRLDLILLTKDSYVDLLQILESKEQVTFAPTNHEKGEVAFGFKNFVHFDGVRVGWDIAIPTTDGNSDTVRGYGFNLDKMHMKLLDDIDRKKKRLWRIHADFDPYQASKLLRLNLTGNLVFESPRYFAKFADIS